MNGKPKVKRMDGIFFQPELVERNIPYVKSCQMANHVIFVSKYSLNCYNNKYGRLPGKKTVILNWVDEDIFYPSPPKEKTNPTDYVAVATSWARPEKGLSRLLDIAKMLGPKDTLFLIGTMPDDIELPPNVKPLGYMSEFRLANTLREMDVLINASENDAAPKVIPEAICCGLMVLCYQSGGSVEFLTGNNGSRTFGYYFKYNSDVIERLNYIREYWKNCVTSSYSHWLHGERKTEALVQAYKEVFRSSME
jgi:glycosyltransferase involved in cell wall biosynthesis